MERSSAINFAKISDIFGKHDERLMNKFMYLGFALKKNNKSIPNRNYDVDLDSSI